MAFARLPLSLLRLVALAAFLCAALPVPASARIEQTDADDTDTEVEDDSLDAGRPARPLRHTPPTATARFAYSPAPPGLARVAVPPVTSAARGPLHLRC